jgi:type I restriction enzyme R subunit
MQHFIKSLKADGRAEKARHQFLDMDDHYKEFLGFVLNQYIRNGFEELDDEKLSSFLQLKYKSIQDAKEKLGDVKTIRNNFIQYQRFLYA